MDKIIYIFMVLDGVISRLQMEYDVSESHRSSVTSTFPYRTKDDYGNPVARAYRQRDHINDRKTDGVRVTRPVTLADVLIVSADNDPEFYLYKLCVNGEIVSNPNLSEGGRIEAAKRQMAGHALPYGFDIASYLFWNAMSYDIVKDYVTKDWFDDTVARIRSQEAFTNDEVLEQVKIVKKMPTDLANRMKLSFAIGAQMRSRADFSSQTSKELKKSPGAYKKGVFKRHSHDTQVELCEAAFFWYDMLKGTSLEALAMSKKAALYYCTNREDDATRVYRELLTNKHISENVRQIIHDKIIHIGYGRNLFNSSKMAFNAGMYDKSFKKLSEFIRVSSGEVRLRLLEEAVPLQRQCIEKLKG